jgi:hypothetical protein
MIFRMMKLLLRLGAARLAPAVAAFFLLGPGNAERGQNRVIPHDPWPVSDAARALHDRLVIGDWHADPLLWDRDLTKRWGRGHVDLPRLIDGNIALKVFTTATKSPSGLN